MKNRAAWPLGVFSILLGYGLASLAFAQVQVPEEDGWPAEVGPQFDGQIIIDNHLTVEQHAEERAQ